jgi:N-acetyl-alpha-D-glucosaminyl L-malate synthase BshA
LVPRDQVGENAPTCSKAPDILNLRPTRAILSDMPMKIGITCYPTYGGSGVVATELGIELAQRGHQIHFISYAQPIRLNQGAPNIHYHEVEVSRYPLFDYPPYDLALATRMAEVSELYELDLLHVHYAIPHSVSAMLARQMLGAGRNPKKLPFVTTLHGTDITLVGQDRSYLPITRYSIEQSDGVTAISEYLRERTLREFEIKNHIQVIYNFVNCDLYCRAKDKDFVERRAEYASNGERILVHVSNFRPVKRIPDVIEIFDRVRKKIPAKLLLLGDGPERSPAEWLAVQKGIHNDVIFLGKREQVHETLGIADVLLLPSELESFGLAALEAMASEVVPIATNVGGVPEVIEHQKSGFLAAVGDVETMAGYAIDILGDESRLRRMGKDCREFARSRFCTSKIIPQYEDFYRRVLERSS